ncbi:MAG: T9SS type A sorting domain-containing protein [Bacteroidota bacterium]
MKKVTTKLSLLVLGVFLSVNATAQVFTNITVSTGTTFTESTLVPGAAPYVDRTHSLERVPDGYYGASFIQTSNSEKNNTEANYLSFDIAEARTLYVGFTIRDTIPDWLLTDQGWTNTGDVVLSSDRDFNIFSKAFEAGTVMLGGASATPVVGTAEPNGYIVLADDGGNNPEAEALPSGFNFFVNNINISIPAVNGIDVVDDEEINDSPVISFRGGNWGLEHFQWPESIDLSSIRATDSLYFRIWSDTSNASEPDNPKIVLYDVDPNTNLEFRAYWNIPEEMHNRTWTDVAIPFPPATHAALVSGIDDESISGLAAQWEYWGAWDNDAGSRVEPDSVNDPRVREFNWDRVQRIGILWDQGNGASGNIYLDDLYVGQRDDIIDDVPSAASSASATSMDGVNTISFSGSPEIDSYTVYFSGSPITDVTDPSVFFWETVAADVTSVEHLIVSPHPNDPEHTYYYAVTSTNVFGENTDVSGTATSVTTAGPQGAYVYELTADQTADMIDLFENEEGIEDRFPTDKSMPFFVNAANNAHPSIPESDEEFSASFKFAYGEDQGDVFFFIYADVNDNEVLYNPIVDQGLESERLEWNSYKRDQIEVRFGNYPVGYVGGTTNRTSLDDFAGEIDTTEIDYLINLRPVAPSDQDLDSLDGIWMTFEGQENYTDLAFLPRVEEKLDEGGNVTGYRILAAISTAEIQLPSEDENSVFRANLWDLPTGSELEYFPFTPAAIDDRNDGRSRSWENTAHQLYYSYKPNFGPRWFATPSDLGASAFVGSEVIVSNENDEFLTSPRSFKLEQNYPNPFNPTTNINFELPSSARVNLTVYNVLGQKVATLVNNVQYQSGAHSVTFDAAQFSSGMYIYRIEAGDFVSSKKMMLIK